jgi:hypothetical protein
MVSPARRRRAWILLLLTWAVIAGVFGARYLSARRDAEARFDREAQEQNALRQMDKLAQDPPAQPEPAPDGPAPTPDSQGPEAKESETPDRPSEG